MNSIYKVTIKNERYKYMKPLNILMLLINAVLLSMAAVMQEKDYFELVWPVLILISIIFIIYERRLRMYRFFKKTDFSATGFLWTMTGWIFISQWWIALLVGAIAALQFFIKEKFVVVFSNEVYIQFLSKKIFNWLELQNVVLKDGLLTIDFKNNKLLQTEILSEESDIKNEAEFNEFCRMQLTTIYN